MSGRPVYLRFVTEAIDADSGRRVGVFQAMFNLIDANELDEYELAEIEALAEWFGNELERPERLSSSRRPGAASRAICWFKSTATEHVSRMHAICRILNEHGVETEMLRSRRPGYVVFEDDFQIAAEPVCETVA